jgi:drug/metabolite transporter (DMT)-like permease
VPPGALLLVLGAALCHSTWNLLVKSEPRRLEIQTAALGVGVLVAAPVLLVHPVTELTATAWALIVASAAFEAAYVFGLSAAYAAGDLSLVYPVARGTATLVVAPLAVVLFGERPSLQGALGIALVVAGLFGSQWRGGGAAGPARWRAPTLAVLTGLTTAGYSLVNKAGVQAAPVLLYGFLVFLLSVVFIVLVRRARGEGWWPAPPAGRWRLTLGVGALMLGAYLGVLVALSLAPVSYVVAAREVSIVVAAVLGATVLRERHSRVRVAGAATIFAGLVLIALGR